MAHYNECYNFKIHILFAQKNLSLFYCNISSKMYYIKNFTVAIWNFFSHHDMNHKKLHVT